MNKLKNSKKLHCHEDTYPRSSYFREKKLIPLWADPGVSQNLAQPEHLAMQGDPISK